MHQSVKIAFLEEEKHNGLGLGLVASEDIPKGSDLIVLPDHIPLRFEAKDGESSALTHLARYVPGTFLPVWFLYLVLASIGFGGI